MTTTPTLVAVSPHLDDVALSAASTVSGWPGRRVVVTVFAGDPPFGLTAVARQFHDDCGLGDDAMVQRREEDRAGCAALGAEPVHLGLPEALYRERSPGVPAIEVEGELFEQDLLGEERPLVDQVTEVLRDAFAPLGPRSVLAPLGEGRHRDHLVVRAALERLHPPWGYYGDQPYVAWGRPGAPGPPGTHERCDLDLGPTALATKVASLTCYRSQMAMLWGPAWSVPVEAGEPGWTTAARREVLWTQR